MRDSAYASLSWSAPCLEHRYGERVHLLSDVMALSMLARIGHPDTQQPDINRLLGRCYGVLYQAVINELFPRRTAPIRTRMEGSVPDAAWTGEVIDPTTPAVLVGVARAGTLPAYQGFEILHDVCDGAGLRVDHIYMQRMADAQGRVTHVETAGSKFGGDMDDAILLLPDPMGATGASIVDAITLCKGLGEGTPKEIVTLHLIVTPEYVRRVTEAHPDVHIYALRLDRGLSSPEALAATPGAFDDERGTNEVQYIVPGAGGLGEIINNSDC
jgi:uracil phosphoribosyltransferase